jgi:hypothetical protein
MQTVDINRVMNLVYDAHKEIDSPDDQYGFADRLKDLIMKKLVDLSLE